jgi:RNA polymerase sigma-70 factor (ECF subfamily)
MIPVHHYSLLEGAWMTNGKDPNRGPLPKNGVELSDSSLLRRVRLGNQDAATHLYLRYAERLRGLARAECSADLARRVDVDDIVQSVFKSFFRGVRQGFYEVPAGEELWKLFLVIALNKIRAKGAFHRAAKRDVRLTVGEEFLAQYTKNNQDRDSDALGVLQLVIDEMLEELPAHQRAIVIHRIEGYEVAEIATRTGRSKRTVERVLQNFRVQLAAVLEQEP